MRDLGEQRQEGGVGAPSARSGIGRAYRRVIRPAGREILVAARRALPVPRMRPAFLIIGAQKAGTTSLYHYLGRHPRIVPALAKEIGYFGEHYDKPAGWYRAHFPIERARRKDRITGEASPAYLSHPLAPERAASEVPDARLIVLVRDPVARAYSHYQHAVDYGRETLSFEEALRQETPRIERAVAAGGDTGPEAIFVRRVYGYRELGIYERHLRRWLEHFPRERMLVLDAEELKEGRLVETLGRVAGFLGLEPWVPGSSLPRLNVRSYAPIPEHPASELREFFRPHNERLRELLQRDFRWA